MGSDLGRLVEEFAGNPVASGRALRILLEADAKSFLVDSRPILQAAPDVPGFYYLLALMQSHDLILKTVCDPSIFTTQESIVLAKRLSRVEPHFDVKLAKVLLAPNSCIQAGEFERNAQSPAGLRLLEVITAISEGSSSMLIARLMHHPDVRVRSKAALLVGKSNKNAKWVKQRLEESDGRVRANAVESLWGVDTDDCRGVFWSAVADPDNRVAGNALLGLYRLGDPARLELILKMSSHPEPDFRQTAAWLMGQTGDLRFLPMLERTLKDPPPALRGHLFGAVMRLKRRLTRLGALPRLQIQILLEGTAVDGWREICFSVHTSAGKEITGLKPTHFALSRNADLITEYDARECAELRALWVGFAIPETCPDAQLGSSEFKRSIDIWRVEAAVPGGLWQAAKTLLNSAAVAPGVRHIILVDDGTADPVESAELEKIDRRARVAAVTLHGIGIRSNILRSTCRESGGKYLEAATENSVPGLLGRFSAHLRAGYCMRYRSSLTDDGSIQNGLKLEVSCQQGLGECLL